MNNVVFIGFSLKQDNNKANFSDFLFNPSIGVISLATWLEFNGYGVHLYDFGYIDLSLKEVIKQIKEINPVMIGLSLYTENYMIGLKVAKVLKEEMPEIKIVLGGPHPSLCPDDVINFPWVDFVSCYEGECSTLELAEAISSNERLISYENIPGIYYKTSDGSVKKSKGRKKICDLDLLPIPKRDYYGMENYKERISVSTSRGCPGRCIYCSATALSGATYRFRGVENVLLEMIMLKHLCGENLQKIYITDDTFTAVPERVRKFAACVLKYNCKICWHCESRVDVMTEELLDLMKKSNCLMIQYGIESGAQEVLNKIQKNIDIEKAKSVIEMTNKKGIAMALSFIIGHYCDTIETMTQTCDMIKECFEKYRAEMALSFNTPFPGTWQHTHLKELGMRVITEDYRHYNLSEPLVETDAFTIQDQMNFMYKTEPYLGYSAKLQKRRFLITDEK